MLLVSEILRAHGGRARWDRISSFSAHISVKGSLLAPDAGDPAAQREIVVEGDARRPALKLFDSADTARYSLYTPDRVEVRSRTGARVAELDRPMDRLAARPPGRPLAPLERTFLIGNAVWSAITGPFALTIPSVTAVELENRQVAVILPEEMDPLCPCRRLRIGEDGVLHRADYEMRHLCPSVADTLSAHIAFDGILVATLRRVRALEPDGRLDDASLLDMEIFDVRFL